MILFSRKKNFLKTMILKKNELIKILNSKISLFMIANEMSFVEKKII